MARIRNLSNDELIIAGPSGPRRVKPDETVEVHADDLAAYVERVDGIPGEFDENGNQVFRTIPSDLWVEVPDLAPAVTPAPAEASAA